jgi:hypothetical protein
VVFSEPDRLLRSGCADIGLTTFLFATDFSGIFRRSAAVQGQKLAKLLALWAVCEQCS